MSWATRPARAARPAASVAEESASGRPGVSRAIDPRLDIEAETDSNGISVTVNIAGNAMEPEITFSSTPALPDEEILARLLFVPNHHANIRSGNETAG